MSKDLSTLIRLHKYRVDEKRRSLGELLGIIANLEKKSENLEAEIISEQQMASSAPESIGMFYGAYAKEVVNKRKEILDEIFDCEKKIAEKQEELRTEYKDLKIFEITQEAREKVVASELTKKEQIILDEMGQESYRRRN
jgi:flagellar export protein FliJ